jgi:tRNA nucleotidyltransferase/poly(A) polymerase
MGHEEIILSPEKSQRIAIVNEAVGKLSDFSRFFGINSLFIVGGYCRALFMNRLWEVQDIDVASAYEDQSVQMGGLFASEFIETPPELYHRTGTVAVLFTSANGSLRIEFQGQSTSSYMYNQDVRDWMHAKGVDDVPLMHNIYGRDFTINALVYDLDDEVMYDPTGLAERDLSDKMIQTILPPDMTIKNNPLVALRALRFKLRYGFVIDPDLKAVIPTAIEPLQKAVPHKRILKEIVKVLQEGGADALDLLKEYGMDYFLVDPLVRDLIEPEAR